MVKCQYNYKGKDAYAFVMSDWYIMDLYLCCCLSIVVVYVCSTCVACGKNIYETY